MYEFKMLERKQNSVKKRRTNEMMREKTDEKSQNISAKKKAADKRNEHNAIKVMNKISVSVCAERKIK